MDEPLGLSAGLRGGIHCGSSPVRLLRNDDRQSPIQGLYPCGEGGGWAGGILSAAADGMRCGEEICKLL